MPLSSGFGNDSDEEDPYGDADLDPESASQEFADYLIGLQTKGKISAKDVCALAFYAKLANLTGKATELALKPSSPTGHFQRHLDKCLGLLDYVDEHSYTLRLPGTDRHSESREVFDIPVVPPHEALADELGKATGAKEKLAEAIANREWGRAYMEHPVVQRAPTGQVVWPLALYVDGVPFQRRDSLVAFVGYSLVTQTRHLLAVLRKSSMCTCGCLGWCSVAPVFAMLHWSFGAMARATAPTRRHDGTAFGAGDEGRSAMAGTSLPRAAVVQIKGDWAEFVRTFGLPAWNTVLHPCFACHASRQTLYDVGSTSPLSGPCAAKTPAEYDAACQNCEVRAYLADRRALEMVVGRLHYDKSRTGSRGRALRAPLPALGLLAGDRLEPQPGLWDVGAFERLEAPVTVVFWRPDNQSLALHRNPVFDTDLGLTTDALALDCLHILHLGVFQNYCSFALWALLEADAWNVGAATRDVLIQVGVTRCRHDLFGWYQAQERADPTVRLYKLQDLTVKMLGKPGRCELATKGAETATLLQYVVHAARTHCAKLGDKGPALQLAGESLLTVLNVLRGNGPALTTAANQELVDAAKRAFVLAGEAGLPLKPKWHLMLHLVARASWSGNPYFHTTFMDEDFNGRLAKLAASAHRVTWHRRVLGHFHWAFSRGEKTQRRRT